MEILDSRGRPTVQTTCHLTTGAVATASVPSGASTGTAEALELRDGDPKRYGGLGCRRAVQNVNDVLNAALRPREFASQAALDRAMLELDGTANKSKLGANAILSVSLAFARACANEKGVPLYQQFADVKREGEAPAEPSVHANSARQQPRPPSAQGSLPRLTVNLFSGGKHAGGQVPIQDVLVVPTAAETIDESLAQVYAIYQAAAKLCHEKYGMRALTADEGGLAPPFEDVDAMLGDAVESIRRAGLAPGRDVHLAVDVASSHFFVDGEYGLRANAPALSAEQMIDQLRAWLDRYPIISIEDGLAEEDWAHWPTLHRAVGDRAQVLGDDFLCTNPTRIRRAIHANAASALLLKVNQIGTLTEAAEAFQLARDAGWAITVSARSGETEDNWLADLAVGWGGDFIKVGSITQSERLAKYNRLLAIENESNISLIPPRLQ